eukprot:768441-Hanusia_phi.AAC.12
MDKEKGRSMYRCKTIPLLTLHTFKYNSEADLMFYSMQMAASFMGLTALFAGAARYATFS